MAGGDVAVCAAAYTYLFHQLNYEDVDPEIVLPVLGSGKDAILNAE